MQRIMAAKIIVNIWIIGTLTMRAMRTATLGEGLSLNKVK
jgi:hypothetical protein